MEPQLVEKIIITDNGVGFTKENLLSFGKLFTAYKKSQFNCKGIGRLSYFATFFEVQIQSTYILNDKKYRIDINVTEKNFYELSKTETVEVSDGPISTVITLKSLNPKFEKHYKLSNTNL